VAIASRINLVETGVSTKPLGVRKREAAIFRVGG
jgi:hypothetical protein